MKLAALATFLALAIAPNAVAGASASDDNLLGVDTRGLSAREIMLKNEGVLEAVAEERDFHREVRSSRQVRGRAQAHVARGYLRHRSSSSQDLVEFTSSRRTCTACAPSRSRATADETTSGGFYLPAIGAKKRISGTARTASFMGTDFTFEDFSIMDGALAGAGRGYKVLRVESRNGLPCWVIESWSVSDELKVSSGYGKRVLWVEQEHFIAVDELFFDKQGAPIKELTRDDIRPAPGEAGAMRPHRVTMKNLKTGHSTELDFLDLVLDRDFDPRIFDPAQLETLP